MRLCALLPEASAISSLNNESHGYSRKIALKTVTEMTLLATREGLLIQNKRLYYEI